MSLVEYRNNLPRTNSLVDLLFSDPFEGFFDLAPTRSRAQAEHWSPSVDIREEEDKFVLVADIPGVDPKDIEITMEKGTLTIKGEREKEHEEERNGYRRLERVRGSFVRRFAFPETVDVEGIHASGKDGVLTLTIPKKESAQPRKITVS